MTDTGNTPDKPEQEDSRWSGQGREAAVARSGPSLLTWLMLGVMLLLALAVIFVLPTLVERYELPFTPRQEEQSAPVTAVVPSSPDDNSNLVSPFDEAQKSRQRREAQDVLSTLLERQEELDGMAVSEWGSDSYDEAVAAARRGDELYRNGEFQAATQAYREGNELLGGLLDSVPEVFDRLMSQAEQAMEEVNADEAARHYETALALRPDSEEASTGLERSQTLEEVERLVSEAEELRDSGELQQARENLEEAVELDDRHERAGEMLTTVREEIREAEFARIMSRGFALLENGEAEAAIETFEEAQNLRPDSSQAEDAIRQAEEQITNEKIAEHRSQALAHEENEQWEQAVAEYEAALELDSNLVFASEGREYAEKRARLDRLIQYALDNPVRLGEEEVYQETEEVLSTARGLEESGPRLRSQIEELGELLEQARQPVQVELISDNATEVTIYQVGELGRFESRQVELMPGRYVAVGTRPGYRDVRREFVVGFGNEPGPITLRCQEQVASAGGP